MNFFDGVQNNEDRSPPSASFPAGVGAQKSIFSAIIDSLLTVDPDELLRYASTPAGGTNSSKNGEFYETKFTNFRPKHIGGSFWHCHIIGK